MRIEYMAGEGSEGSMDNEAGANSKIPGMKVEDSSKRHSKTPGTFTLPSKEKLNVQAQEMQETMAKLAVKAAENQGVRGVDTHLAAEYVAEDAWSPLNSSPDLTVSRTKASEWAAYLEKRKKEREGQASQTKISQAELVRQHFTEVSPSTPEEEILARAASSGFSPEQVWGQQGNKDQIPETRIPKEAMTYLIELPVGLSADQLKQKVLDLIYLREQRVFEPDFVNDLEKALTPYIETDYALVKDLLDEADARADLRRLGIDLLIRNYADMGENPLLASRYDFLWNNWSESANLRTLVQIMEQQDGQYFREGAGGPIHAQVAASLQHWYGAGGPGTMDEQKRNVLAGVAGNLLNTTLMASFYVGPVDTAGQLVDRQIMDAIGNPGAQGSMDRYYKNIPYWEKWRQARNAGQLNFAAPADTGVNNGRRLMYWPEDLQSGPGNGKAAGLRKSMELYVRSLPQFYGYENLTDMLNNVQVNQGIVPSRWGSSVKGGSEALAASFAVLAEPLNGEPRDLKGVMEGLKNVSNMAEKFAGFMAPVPELKGHAVGTLVTSVVNYVNSNEPDRKREFKYLPKLGDLSRNEMLKAFRGQMKDEAQFQQFLRVVRTGEWLGIRVEARGPVLSWLGEILATLQKVLMGR